MTRDECGRRNKLWSISGHKAQLYDFTLEGMPTPVDASARGKLPQVSPCEPLDALMIRIAADVRNGEPDEPLPD